MNHEVVQLPKIAHDTSGAIAYENSWNVSLARNRQISGCRKLSEDPECVPDLRKWADFGLVKQGLIGGQVNSAFYQANNPHFLVQWWK